VAKGAELVVTKRAENDFRSIWRAIARHDERAADRLLLRLDEKLQLLRASPEMCVLRDDIRPGLRMMVEGNYLVLYEYRRREAVIEIVAVVDGRRDVFGLF
jgi:toxin ParE1/3/4